MVTNAPLPLPTLSLALPPPTLELEQPRATVAWLWNLAGAAGLFGSVLFMHILIAPGAVPATSTASLQARPDAQAALAVESAHADSTTHELEPKAVEPAAPHAAAPIVAPAPAAVPSVQPAPAAAVRREAQREASTRSPSMNAPPQRSAPASITRITKVQKIEKVERVEPERKPAAPARPKIAVIAASTAAEPRAMGTLRVNSLPWAEIYIDDVFVGTTPRSDLSVKAGRHRLKLVNRPLDMAKSFVVDVRAAQVVTKIVNLSP